MKVDGPIIPGILAVYQRYFGADKDKAALRTISDAELQHIYRKGYWPDRNPGQNKRDGSYDISIDLCSFSVVHNSTLHAFGGGAATFKISGWELLISIADSG